MLSAQNSKRKSSGKTTRRTFHLCLIVPPEHTQMSLLQHQSVAHILKHRKHSAISCISGNIHSYIPPPDRLFCATAVCSQCSSAHNGLWLWPPVTQLQRAETEQNHRPILLHKHSWSRLFFLSRFFWCYVHWGNMSAGAQALLSLARDMWHMVWVRVGRTLCWQLELGTS